MGRKQKLRQEKKRNIKNKAAATAEVTATAAAVATTFSTEDAVVETAEEKALVAKVRQEERALALENQLPKSDTYVQAMAGTNNISYGEQLELFKRGITENECVHSMNAIGYIHLNTREEKRKHLAFSRAKAAERNPNGDSRCLPKTLKSKVAVSYECTDKNNTNVSVSMDNNNNNNNNNNSKHLALPWYLEGAIRGSIQSTRSLMGRFYIQNAAALHGYWGEIFKKHLHFSYDGNALMEHKDVKDLVERECAICSKTDTKTLTLKQCSGCSVYCYCSEECQTKHWEEHKHRNECKQVHILNKYHKPYAKEIRDAVIRGDKEIPSLEKLRYKLGLTRPLEDYQELINYNTHDGKSIDPKDYIVAREDGTVWVGSIPSSSPIGTSFFMDK